MMPSTITNGQKVRLKHVASGSPSTARVTILTIGGMTGNFRSTTAAQ